MQRRTKNTRMAGELLEAIKNTKSNIERELGVHISNLNVQRIVAKKIREEGIKIEKLKQRIRLLK